MREHTKANLWVVEADTNGDPIARILPSGFKTPRNIDVDGFKRVDGRGLRISAVSKTAVSERHFGNKNVKYIQKEWGEPLIVIFDVKKDNKNKIVSYRVSGHGWLDFDTAFKMTCHHEIDNARPVFPKNGRPYIRSKRDKSILNNFSKKGES